MRISSAAGFTLLELMVVIFVFAIVSTAVFANYSSFNERLAVRSASEEISSSVRRAQAFGLAVKGITIGGTTYFPGYGIYFTLANPFSYVAYADINADRLYQEANEKVEDMVIQANSQIYQLCANAKSNPPGDCTLTNIIATYTRPIPQVVLKKDGGLSTCGGMGDSYCDVGIKIRGPRGTTKTIVLWQSGQISIE